MWTWILRAFGILFAVFMLGNIVGCDKPSQTQEALLFLQQGKAEGELTLASSPVIAAGMDNRFYFGGDKTLMTFNGSIDFADRVRSVPAYPAEPRRQANEPVPPPVDSNGFDPVLM